MIVVDASVVLEVLLSTEAGASIADRIFDGSRALHAPHLMDVEVVQVLRRYVVRGELTEDRARQALDLLQDLPLRRHEHWPLIGRMWALRKNLTAYDAAYVALAEALRATLVTRDRALASVPGLGALVELM